MAAKEKPPAAPKYRVRAVETPGHTGLFRGGRFWSSSRWTVVELSAHEARALEADKRLMVELGEGAANVDAAKSEALEVAKELAAEREAHEETKRILDGATKEIARLEGALATAKAESEAAKAEAESFKARIREQAKAAEASAEKPKG